MNFKYVFQFFSIRKNDCFLRFLLIVVTIFEHLKFQKNCARFDIFYLENRFLKNQLHAELNFFDQSLDIINIVEKR
jgi:hypothetical protein